MRLRKGGREAHEYFSVEGREREGDVGDGGKELQRRGVHTKRDLLSGHVSTMLPTVHQRCPRALCTMCPLFLLSITAARSRLTLLPGASSPRFATLHSTPQHTAAIVAAHINPGCKDLEEDRGGKGSCTEERGGRKVWGLPHKCFRCCQNTAVVSTVVKF
jgi:hypothetical protein